jgi:hypothetical protein
MGPSQPAIFFILSFALSTTSLLKQPSPTFGILSILPVCHNQSSATFASSTDNIPSTNSTNNIPSSGSTNHLPKSKPKPTHHLHLYHKSKNPSNKIKLSQLMAQSLQSPGAPISSLTPSDNAETITEK